MTDTEAYAIASESSCRPILDKLDDIEEAQESETTTLKTLVLKAKELIKRRVKEEEVA